MCVYVCVHVCMCVCVCVYIFLFQEELLEVDGIPATLPSQDTKEHTVLLDDSHQQPLYNNNSGQIQLEMKMRNIVNFNAESSDYLLYQPNSSDDRPHLSLVCIHIASIATTYGHVTS